MDNFPNVQSASDDIEQSLMDLELLGVTIKEEVLDDQDGRNATSNEKSTVVGSTRKARDPQTPEGAGADSHESPSAGNGARSLNPWTTTKCIFCEQVLISCEMTNGQPKLLECLHSACDGCIKSKLDESRRDYNGTSSSQDKSVVCPVCEMASTTTNMIEQQFVVERLTTDGNTSSGSAPPMEQHCSSCSDDNVATAWCVECSEFICDVCVQAHQRLKITKDHTIKSKEEALQDIQSASNSSSTDLFCKEHTQERLSLFCETCDKLTCRDCQLLHHRDHKYQFSTEMAAQARSFVTSLLSEVSYKRVLLGSAMMVIQDRQALIADKKKALVHEITETVVKLTNTINTRGKQLVLRLNEVCDAKQKTLNEKKAALEQLSAVTDHCIEFVNAALELGSDNAVLYSKKQVTQHLQRIKSRRADIPNPEIPVRIHLALEKVPDLIKVLSSIGAIMVDGKPYPPQVSVSNASAPSTNRPPSTGSMGSIGGPSSQGSQMINYNSPPPNAVVHQGNITIQTQGFSSGHGVSRSQQPSPSQQPPPPYPQLTHQQSLQMPPMLMRQNSGGAMLPAITQGPVVHPGAMSRGGAMVRHPHVTSTTHPHHMAGLQNDMNLRGLLGAPQYAQQQQQHQRSAQQQQFARQTQQTAMAAAFQGSAGYTVQSMHMNSAIGLSGSGRMVAPPNPRTVNPNHPAIPPHKAPSPSQHHHPAYTHHQQGNFMQQQAKWHIPQQHTNGVYDNSGSTSPYPSQLQSPSQPHHHDSFKITIGRQPTPQQTSHPAILGRQPSTPSAVTSTNPKTPSPSLNGSTASNATDSLDKLCQDSVNDLMATIAKLDSNGVQVLAEGGASASNSSGAASNSAAGTNGTRSHSGASPHVHSSTDDAGPMIANQLNDSAVTDPNEDWCAVCMDGGELMCCDKCPKVFHQYCHIPTIDKLPEETESWQCLLCLNFADLPLETGAKSSGLSPRMQKVVERIVLEVYCQYDLSKHFREPVPLSNIDYHVRIQQPMSLDMIRVRVQPGPSRYTKPSEMVCDMRLMFRNVYSYFMPDSVEYRDCKRLEMFFDEQLSKWLPDLLYSETSLEEMRPSSAKRTKINGLGE